MTTLAASYTFSVPLPPKACSPNSRPHWAARAKAVKGQRTAARWAAIIALEMTCPRWQSVTIQATFYKSSRRAKVLDVDNAIASLKGLCDGIADSGMILNDRGITWLPIRQVLGDAAGGRNEVEITITKVEEPQQ